MTDKPSPTQEPAFRAVLRPHRSLGPQGFLILMGILSALSFVAGLTFTVMGAWPVFAFFGLDVALVYLAFKLSYRSGRAYELIELSSDILTLTRVDPAGRRQSVDFNPYWVRVELDEQPNGRTVLQLALRQQRHSFGHCLNDDEKRDFATALQSALVSARHPNRS
jgi:uncharacterized membrane protein